MRDTIVTSIRFTSSKRKVVRQISEAGTPYMEEVSSDFVPAPGSEKEFTPGHLHYRTRDGKPARILAGDIEGGSRPIVAAIKVRDDWEEVRTYYADGRTVSNGIHEYDLINAPSHSQIAAE